MGIRPPNTTLDRFPDSDGNYEPGNCRWATHTQQQRNRSSNRVIELDGVKKTLTEWCEMYGINSSTVSTRLRLGWTESDAIKSPLKRPGTIGNTKKIK